MQHGNLKLFHSTIPRLPMANVAVYHQAKAVLVNSQTKTQDMTLGLNMYLKGLSDPEISWNNNAWIFMIDFGVLTVRILHYRSFQGQLIAPFDAKLQ